MGCSACGTATYNTLAKEYVFPGDCDYTQDMLISWKDKLLCIQNNETYGTFGITRPQLNSYLGIVLSGINVNYNVCYLADKLDEIKPLIIQIINYGNC